MKTYRLLLMTTITLTVAMPLFGGTVQVDQTGPETFSVSFEKTTRPGGIEGAMKSAKRYAAALCSAAGYTWYRVLDRQAEASGFSLLPTRGQVAVVEVRFLDAQEEDRKTLRCEGSKKDLRKMKKWLRTLEYERPSSATTDPEPPASGTF